jgi:hypothetical protein
LQPYDPTNLDLRPRCGFTGRCRNLLQHTRSGPVWQQGQPDRPYEEAGRPPTVVLQAHLWLVCARRRAISKKTIICVKQSQDEEVMPVLSNPALRLTSSDSRLQIWQLISISIISMSSLQCCTLILHFGMLLYCSFVGVGLEYHWDTSWSPMT